jgi:hypothetical protein
MIDTVLKYIQPTINENNHRFKSWEHCYIAFSGNNNPDTLALNLAFYLASWGMYRGSSGLLWKDYKIHIPAIELIVNFNDLKTTNWEEPNIERIIVLKERLKNYYGEIDYNNGKGLGLKKVTATDTLISKIILGTIGCLPAFDRYFNIGFKGNSNIQINKSVLEDLYSEIEMKIHDIKDCQEHIKHKLNFDYPVMKIIDMYYWQRGFEKCNSKKP